MPDGEDEMSLADVVNVPALSSAVGATIFAWLGAYVAVKAKNLATQQDLQFLQNELRSNTEITKSVDQRFTRSDVVWRNELSFRQQQLSEFYGPIYGYLTSQRHVYDLWIEGKMNEKNVEVKHLFREQNQAVRNLIINKTHLIEGRIMPDSFVRFCSSTLIFDFYAAVAAEGGVPEHLKADARSAFPHDFYEHITTVTESLKARIEDLHASYAPPLRGTETSGGQT